MITTTLSSKGQVVVPRLVRSKLRLATSTRLPCEIQGDSVVPTPEIPTPSAKADFVTAEFVHLHVPVHLHDSNDDRDQPE